MDPKLKVLIDELKAVSVYVPEKPGGVWIRYDDYVNLILKRWPTAWGADIRLDVDKNEKLNNFEPKLKGK